MTIETIRVANIDEVIAAIEARHMPKAPEPTPSAVVVSTADSAYGAAENKPCREALSPVSWCLASDGIGESTRLRVVAAYRARGGSFGDRVSYAALAGAMREVRRTLEATYPRIAEELTYREDRLEMWLRDRRRGAQ